jgi:hypothetical protein
MSVAATATSVSATGVVPCSGSDRAFTEQVLAFGWCDLTARCEIIRDPDDGRAALTAARDVDRNNRSDRGLGAPLDA